MQTMKTDRKVHASEAVLIGLYRCNFCGEGVRVTGITLDEASRWKHGELIQRVWPHMTPDERECIISRACPTCYEEKVAPAFEPDEDMCEWCGGYATEDHPVNETSITPPTADHPAEIVYAHAQCASEWALSSI